MNNWAMVPVVSKKKATRGKRVLSELSNNQVPTRAPGSSLKKGFRKRARLSLLGVSRDVGSVGGPPALRIGAPNAVRAGSATKAIGVGASAWNLVVENPSAFYGAVPVATADADAGSSELDRAVPIVSASVKSTVAAGPASDGECAASGQSAFSLIPKGLEERQFLRLPDYGTSQLLLPNAGNTCFANSALQAIVHTPALAQVCIRHLQSCKSSSAGTLFCPMGSLGRLVDSICTGKDGEVVASASEFYRDGRLRLLSPDLLFSRQEDSLEFLHAVIESAGRAEVLGCNSWHGQYDIRAYAENEEKGSIFSACAGETATISVCRRCGVETGVTKEKFIDIALDLSPKVSQSLLSFFGPQNVDKSVSHMHCPSCRTRVRRAIFKELVVAPNSLILQLKRFEYTANDQPKKLSGVMEFEEFLWAGPLMRGRSAESLLYRLTSVVFHQGESLASGHFFVFVLDPNDKWSMRNDLAVSSTTFTEMQSFGDEFTQAYVCVYSRCTSEALSVGAGCYEAVSKTSFRYSSKKGGSSAAHNLHNFGAVENVDQVGKVLATETMGATFPKPADVLMEMPMGTCNFSKDARLAEGTAKTFIVARTVPTPASSLPKVAQPLSKWPMRLGSSRNTSVGDTQGDVMHVVTAETLAGASVPGRFRPVKLSSSRQSDDGVPLAQCMEAVKRGTLTGAESSSTSAEWKGKGSGSSDFAVRQPKPLKTFRPYPCPHCSLRFNQSTTVASHIRSMHRPALVGGDGLKVGSDNLESTAQVVRDPSAGEKAARDHVRSVAADFPPASQSLPPLPAAAILLSTPSLDHGHDVVSSDSHVQSREGPQLFRENSACPSRKDYLWKGNQTRRIPYSRQTWTNAMFYVEAEEAFWKTPELHAGRLCPTAKELGAAGCRGLKGIMYRHVSGTEELAKILGLNVRNVLSVGRKNKHVRDAEIEARPVREGGQRQTNAGYWNASRMKAATLLVIQRRPSGEDLPMNFPGARPRFLTSNEFEEFGEGPHGSGKALAMAISYHYKLFAAAADAFGLDSNLVSRLRAAGQAVVPEHLIPVPRVTDPKAAVAGARAYRGAEIPDFVRSGIKVVQSQVCGPTAYDVMPSKMQIDTFGPHGLWSIVSNLEGGQVQCGRELGLRACANWTLSLALDLIKAVSEKLSSGPLSGIQPTHQQLEMHGLKGILGGASRMGGGVTKCIDVLGLKISASNDWEIGPRVVQCDASPDFGGTQSNSPDVVAIDRGSDESDADDVADVWTGLEDESDEDGEYEDCKNGGGENEPSEDDFAHYMESEDGECHLLSFARRRADKFDFARQRRLMEEHFCEVLRAHGQRRGFQLLVQESNEQQLKDDVCNFLFDLSFQKDVPLVLSQREENIICRVSSYLTVKKLRLLLLEYPKVVNGTAVLEITGLRQSERDAEFREVRVRRYDWIDRLRQRMSRRLLQGESVGGAITEEELMAIVYTVVPARRRSDWRWMDVCDEVLDDNLEGLKNVFDKAKNRIVFSFYKTVSAMGVQWFSLNPGSTSLGPIANSELFALSQLLLSRSVGPLFPKMRLKTIDNWSVVMQKTYGCSITELRHYAVARGFRAFVPHNLSAFLALNWFMAHPTYIAIKVYLDDYSDYFWALVCV